MTIIKSPLDNRKYLSFILKNKLQILLIKSNDVTISNVSMCVNVGSYMDTIEGIAHFLEHMLFMGTKKYPSEKGFMDFISNNGGYSNAFTAQEYTNYHYEIKNSALKKSLDMFAQFFINPLFNKNSVEKEINAVDSEHKKNITNDMRRLLRVIKYTANPQYPFHKFATGSNETLNIDGIRDKLIDFYNKYYSSNIMKLVILGNFDINKMKKYITDIFSKIKNNNINIDICKHNPFIENKKINNDYNYLLEIVPIKNINKIGIIWNKPFEKEQLINKEIEYLTHVIGHEGKNSLYSTLHDYGFIDYLNCGYLDKDSCHNFIYIDIGATDKGFKNRNLIIHLIYYFIEHIFFKKINKNTYNEIKKGCDIMFKYNEMMNSVDYIVYLSMNMYHYDIQNIIYGDYKMNNFNNSINKKIKNLQRFIRKENSVIVLSSYIFKNKTNKIEKWYKTNYNYIPSNKLKFNKNKLNKLSNLLNIPPKNNFIPNVDELKLIKNKKKFKKPLILPNKYLFYMHDVKYKSPVVICGIIINTPNISSTINNYLKCLIFIQSFNDYFKKYNYNASIANFDYTINLFMDIIEIKLNGYSSKFSYYVQFFLDYLSNFKISKKNFENTKKKIIKQLENMKFDEPFLQTKYYLKELCLNKNFTILEKLNGIKSIKYKDITNIFGTIINKLFLKIYIHGNISENKSIDIYKLINNKFNYSVYKIQNIEKFKNIKKNNIQNHNIISLNENENNSCTNVVFFIDYVKPGLTDNWEKNIILSSLIGILLKSEFFDNLRTKQQLGYIVSFTKSVFGNNRFPYYIFSFLVQSSVKKSLYLKNKIFEFIDNNAKKIIFNITNKEFLELIDSYKTILLEKPSNIHDYFEKYYSEIKNSNYIFNIPDILVKYIDKIKINDLHEFFNKYIINNNNKIIIQIDPKK
jgi:insulysin